MPQVSTLRSPNITGVYRGKISSVGVILRCFPDPAALFPGVPTEETWELLAQAGSPNGVNRGYRPISLRVDNTENPYDLELAFFADASTYVDTFSKLTAPAGKVSEFDLYGVLGSSKGGEGAAYIWLRQVYPTVLFETNPTAAVEGMVRLFGQFFLLPVR